MPPKETARSRASHATAVILALALTTAGLAAIATPAAAATCTMQVGPVTFVCEGSSCSAGVNPASPGSGCTAVDHE
jgi:hypothetical protein